MIVWVDDGDGSSMGWDCEITEEGQDPDDFRRLQGNYAYLGIGKDGKPIFFESNETLSEELHLKPTQEPSIPFRGRRRGHMDYFAEGLMQSGIDAGEELLDAGMHPWKFFMEIRGHADEIAKKPALAAQIPPALLSELFSDLDDFNNVDSKEQAAKLGKTTGKLLIFLAPGGAAAKGINLGKYPRLLKIFNKVEARGTNKVPIERGIGGKGWRGDKIWKENIELVKRGGTIERINGEIISQSEAESLTKEIKGTILRVEGGHMKGTNPHKFPHINYITQDGKKGTIRILEVIRANESGKF